MYTSNEEQDQATVLAGVGEHSGGVASVVFARNVETHRMRLLTTGNSDLAIYEWVLTPCLPFIKRYRCVYMYTHMGVCVFIFFFVCVCDLAL